MFCTYILSLVLVADSWYLEYTGQHRAVLCVVPVLVRYHTHTKVVHEGIKIYYGHIHVKEV